jgi:hypothetical protein
MEWVNQGLPPGQVPAMVLNQHRAWEPDEVPAELRREKRTELRGELRRELVSELRAEQREELVAGQRPVLRLKLRSELPNVVPAELPNELPPELRGEFPEELPKEQRPLSSQALSAIDQLPSFALPLFRIDSSFGYRRHESRHCRTGAV